MKTTKILIIFIMLTALLLCIGSANADTFTYEKTLTLSAPPSGVTNYPYEVILYNTTGADTGRTAYLGNTVQSDFDDIRFYDSNNELLDFKITDFYADHVIAYVEIPTWNAPTTIKLRYGNPNSIQYSSGEKTFSSYTQFDGQDFMKRQTVLIGASGWEESSVQEPCVIYESGTFKMWYHGGFSLGQYVGYATSSDGISWVKHGQVTGMTGTYDSPFVYRNTDGYLYMYACNHTTGASGRGAFDLYRSSDGEAWTLIQYGVIQKGVSGWSSTMLGNIYVWQEGATYKALYEATSPSNYWNIGYATSSDGINWTPYASNPVLGTTTRMAGGPEVHKIGSTYYAWVHRSVASTNFPSDIYCYSSSDCITWTAVYNSPIMPRVFSDEGATASYGQTADASLVEVNGVTYFYYSATANGNGGSTFKIKLAKANMGISDLVNTRQGMNFDVGTWGAVGFVPSTNINNGVASVTGAIGNGLYSGVYGANTFFMANYAVPQLSYTSVAGYMSLTNQDSASFWVDTGGYPGHWVATTYETSTNELDLGTATGTGYHTFKIRRYGTSNVIFYVDDSIVANKTTQVPAGDVEIRFRQQDPTSGTQNIKWVAIGKTMANEPVGTWSDTTTLNVLTDVYFNLDDITANIPMPLDSVTNLSIYNYNTSTYNNVTNPPNTVYFPYWSGDTIRVISYAPGYVTVDRNYIIDNSITEYDEVHGYYYSGYSPGYLNGHSGHAKVNYVQDNPTSDDVLIYGTTLDQYGTKIPNLELWLLDGVSNAVIEHTYSNMWGTFGVYVDPTLGRKNYRIMVNYPGYGNLTPIIKYDGGVFNMDNPFYWPDAWTSPNGQGNNNPYSQLNIDTLLSLKYTPSVTVTPTPSNNPPPAGYYEISGKVTDSNGVLTSNIPIYLLYSNGTVSATTTTNTAGAYALYFPTSMTFNIYTLKCGMRTGYDNSTVQNFYSLALPELFQYTPDNNLKLNFMLPVDDYVPNYIIKGRVYDSGTNTGLISAYVTLYDDTNADIAYALTNGAGSYSLTLPDGLAFGTYRVGYAHAGYYEQNLTVVYPNDFGGASSITHDAPMAPIPGGSLSNIIGHVYATNTGVVIQNALVVAKYHANATIVKSAYSDAYGAARIYNIGNGEYDIVVTATGFNSMSWYLNISTQNTYEAQIGLTPVVAPTAYPTIAPTATPSPTSPINALNPIEALISLLMLVGMDRGTAQILLGFILVLLGAFVMAIISQKVALEMNAGYLIAGGAAAGFVAACMIPTSTGTLWPQWLLLIAGILTVVLAVGFFLKQSNTGG